MISAPLTLIINREPSEETHGATNQVPPPFSSIEKTNPPFLKSRSITLQPPVSMVRSVLLSPPTWDGCGGGDGEYKRVSLTQDQDVQDSVIWVRPRLGSALATLSPVTGPAWGTHTLPPLVLGGNRENGMLKIFFFIFLINVKIMTIFTWVTVCCWPW